MVPMTGIQSMTDHLAQPLGDATQEGYEYKRDFKHASVYLNIESKIAKITWK